MEKSLQTKSFSKFLANLTLRLLNWRLEVVHPGVPKFVMIGAPHTSNWDFLYFLLLRFGSGIELNWVGKASLFRWPLGPVMRRLGGVPVHRNVRGEFVTQIVNQYNRLDRFILTLAPEGTRRKTEFWKTGFYYIALGAGIPIALGFVDYKVRTVGIGPLIFPTGDIQSDFDQIRAFYATKTGKYPHKQGEIRVRPDIHKNSGLRKP